MRIMQQFTHTYTHTHVYPLEMISSPPPPGNHKMAPSWHYRSFLKYLRWHKPQTCPSHLCSHDESRALNSNMLRTVPDNKATASTLFVNIPVIFCFCSGPLVIFSIFEKLQVGEKKTLLFPCLSALKLSASESSIIVCFCKVKITLLLLWCFFLHYFAYRRSTEMGLRTFINSTRSNKRAPIIIHFHRLLRSRVEWETNSKG